MLDPQESFGRVLRELRLSHGLTQEQLALAAGIERNYVSLIERGVHQPALRILFRIADALGCAPSELIYMVEVEMRCSK